MKKIFINLIILLCAAFQPVAAQEAKLRVAVLEPTISGKTFDEGTSAIVREMVTTSLVETGNYTIIERSLIDKIMKEQKFSNSGAVDETQASELGKLAGANKVIVCVLSSYADKGMLSLKMIDVESASIENQKSKLVKQEEVLDQIIPLSYDLMGIEYEAPEDTQQPQRYAQQETNGEKEKKNGGLNILINPYKYIFKKSAKEKFAERMDEEISKNAAARQGNTSAEGVGVSLEFAGVANKKNPSAKIFIDDEPIGEGSLTEGFSINFTDPAPGKHVLKIEWSDTVTSQSYDIDTGKKRKFTFEFTRGGFGYEFKLK